jgi:hypothetical protein
MVATPTDPSGGGDDDDAKQQRRRRREPVSNKTKSALQRETATRTRSEAKSLGAAGAQQEQQQQQQLATRSQPACCFTQIMKAARLQRYGRARTVRSSLSSSSLFSARHSPSVRASKQRAAPLWWQAVNGKCLPAARCSALYALASSRSHCTSEARRKSF